MHIYYHLSEYISHRTSGMDYIHLLRSLGHGVTLDASDIPEVETAVLHDEPPLYDSLFACNPALRSKRTIGLCVWENSLLAPGYRPPLRLVDEIWTPSRFSLASLIPHFPEAKVLPHLVRRVPPSAEDVSRVKALLPGGRVFRFFSVIDAANPRKNLPGLLKAFLNVRKRLGDAVQLVVKQYRQSVDLSSLPGVVSLDGRMSDGEMAALFILCDAYVSAHHAEGWGLGISQAMAYGKPVAATAYSGNMDYMDERNSFPVPFTMVPVSEEMLRRVPAFTREMFWAEVDVEALASRMVQIAQGRVPEALPGLAAEICTRFGPETVGRRLQELLDERTER